jgi:hypothetical protein
MKKLIFILTFTLFASLSLFIACNKENLPNEKIQTSIKQKFKLFGITINWDIARKRCYRYGEGCMCGFGLCNPHRSLPGSDRSAEVFLSKYSEDELLVKFNSNIETLRENEDYFSIDEDMPIPNELVSQLDLSKSTFAIGDYPFNKETNSVILKLK